MTQAILRVVAAKESGDVWELDRSSGISLLEMVHRALRSVRINYRLPAPLEWLKVPGHRTEYAMSVVPTGSTPNQTPHV